MKDNQLTILTQMAIPAEQIDAETARAELAEATAQVPTDDKAAATASAESSCASAMKVLASFASR